jgi:hypothetical protein
VSRLISTFHSFGGGDELAYNLIFSTCRNSGDHGPFVSLGEKKKSWMKSHVAIPFSKTMPQFFLELVGPTAVYHGRPYWLA